MLFRYWSRAAPLRRSRPGRRSRSSCRRLVELEEDLADCRFAAPRLADEAEGLSLFDGEGNPVHGPEITDLFREEPRGDGEVLLEAVSLPLYISAPPATSVPGRDDLLPPTPWAAPLHTAPF